MPRPIATRRRIKVVDGCLNITYFWVMENKHTQTSMISPPFNDYLSVASEAKSASAKSSNETSERSPLKCNMYPLISLMYTKLSRASFK